GKGDAAGGGKGDVRRAAERTLRRCGESAHIDLEQFLSLAGEFVDHGAGSVDSPDISRGIDPDAVGNFVESLAPGAKDAALFVDGDHRLGVGAAPPRVYLPPSI